MVQGNRVHHMTVDTVAGEGVASHVASALRKQRAMIAGAQCTDIFLMVLVNGSSGAFHRGEAGFTQKIQLFNQRHWKGCLHQH